MLNHVMVGTNDLERAKRFYDAVLGVLGAPEGVRNVNATGQSRVFYRHDGSTFGVSEPIDGQPATHANGGTIGFKCRSAEQLQAFHDTIVQISNDPEFKEGVTTVYNNDTDNSSKLGVGTDREYFELEWGRVVAVKGLKARYVRGFTKGSTLSAINCWQEIEVYALPAK